MFKKIALIAAFIAAFSTAQAVEIGINDGTNLSSTENVWGVSVGNTVHGYNLTAGFNRSATADLYSLVNSAQVAKMGPVAVDAKVGGIYVNSKAGSAYDGYAAMIGIGASMPVTKTITAGLDYNYQAGQDRVAAQNGSRIVAGLKFNF